MAVNYTQLGRIMRQATQHARMRTLSPLVGYVGAAVDIWRWHGLVTEEESRAFKDALAAAGAELSLAPQVVVVDPEVAARKAAVVGRQRPAPGDSHPPRAGGDDARPAQEAVPGKPRARRGR